MNGEKQHSDGVTWSEWIHWSLSCSLAQLIGPLLTISLLQPESPREKLDWLSPSFASLAINLIEVTIVLLLTWSVLRRIAPQLKWWTWVFAMTASALLSFAVELALHTRVPALLFVIHIEPGVTAPAPVIFAGLVITVVTATLKWLIPSWLIAKASNRSILVFIAAAVTGACSAYLFTWLYPFIVVSDHFSIFELSSAEKLHRLIFKGSLGAIWGACSATTAAFLWNIDRTMNDAFEKAAGRRRAAGMAAVTFIFVTMVFLASYMLGQKRISAGFPTIQKSTLFAASP